MDAPYRLARGIFIAVLLFTAIVIVAPQVHRETAATDLQPEYRHVATWRGTRKVAQYCVPRNNVEDSQRIYCKQKQNWDDVTPT
jgi:hypothetical protein